jgi:hypothetical protein
MRIFMVLLFSVVVFAYLYNIYDVTSHVNDDVHRILSLTINDEEPNFASLDAKLTDILSKVSGNTTDIKTMKDQMEADTDAEVKRDAAAEEMEIADRRLRIMQQLKDIGSSDIDVIPDGLCWWLPEVRAAGEETLASETENTVQDFINRVDLAFPNEGVGLIAQLQDIGLIFDDLPDGPFLASVYDPAVNGHLADHLISSA